MHSKTIETYIKGIDRDRTRTCNPQIRSLVPYPLGHTVLCVGWISPITPSVASHQNMLQSSVKTTFHLHKKKAVLELSLSHPTHWILESGKRVKIILSTDVFYHVSPSFFKFTKSCNHDMILFSSIGIFERANILGISKQR